MMTILIAKHLQHIKPTLAYFMDIPKIRLTNSYKETLDSRIRESWCLLLSQFREGTLFYQSPSYFDHLALRTSDDKLFLAIAQCEDGEVTGIVPLLKKTSTFDFRISSLHLGQFSFSGVRIYGNNLLFPESHELFDALFEQLDTALPDCEIIEVRGIPVTSALWAYFKECQPLQRKFQLYSPNGIRWCHTVGIPESYESYLAGFKRKKRYNLTRQIRRLDEWGNNSLTLHCVQTPAEVPLLLNAITALEIHSNHIISIPGNTEIVDLAWRGLLQSYILTINGQPCAMAFCTTFMDALLIHGFAHDRQLNQFSPGTVLDMLLIKDLIERTAIRNIDYGFGEPRFRLTNKLDQRISVFLIRKSTFNGLAIMAHASFSYLLNRIKSFARS